MSRRHNPRVDLLRRIPALAGHGEKDLSRMAALMDDLQVQPGTVLTHEGDRGHQVFLILEGVASCTVEGREVDQLGPGEWVGEMALLDNRPRSATVTAVTRMQLLVIGEDAFGFFLSEPIVMRAIAQDLATRIRENRDRERLA